MSILKNALAASVESRQNYIEDAEAGIVLAQAEQATADAIGEHATYDAGIESLTGLVVAAKAQIQAGVSVEANGLYATSTAVIADSLGIEQAQLGTMVTNASVEGVKEIIASIKRIIVQAFKAAGDFFSKFLMSVSKFFAANEKSRDVLIEQLGKLEGDVKFKEDALKSVSEKAAVVLYVEDYSAVKNIKVSSERVDGVVGGLNGVADKIIDTAEAIYASIADGMVTYTNTGMVDSKETAALEKDGTITFIGQKAGKLIATVTGEGKGKIVEVSLDEKAGKDVVVKAAKATFIKTLADDLKDFGDKDAIGKATDGIMKTVKSLQKDAEKDLDGEQKQLQALSALYRFVISIGFTESKTILDRYTACYSLGKAIVAGVDDGENKEEKKKEEK